MTDAAQPSLTRRQTIPFVREPGRGHRVRHGPAPNRRSRRTAAVSPFRDLLASNPDPVQQPLQMQLWMRLVASAVLVGPERIPFLLAHHAQGTERRQDYRTAGHSRHPGEERGDRGSTCRDAGCDGESFWGGFGPADCRCSQEPVAAVCQVDPAEHRQLAGPHVDDRPEPIQGDLPVAGQFRIIHRIGERRGRHLFHQHGVKCPTEVRGEAEALSGTVCRQLATNEACKGDQPRQGFHRRRNGLTADRI